MAASIRASIPRPWMALTGKMRSKPSSENSVVFSDCAGVVGLVGGDEDGLAGLAESDGDFAVEADDTFAGVDDEEDEVGGSMARRTCSKAAATMGSSVFSPRRRPMPPVSTRVKGRPCHSASALMRSRVTPGWSWTMAIRRPAMRLNRADLPTLGRPTMAISAGMGIAWAGAGGPGSEKLAGQLRIGDWGLTERATPAG
jgi:hypothetical protein